MELYTSLLQLKRVMNNGELPPMTPLTEKAAKVIDPETTIGMGALVEDEEKGLRCPVKGCKGTVRHPDGWFHVLTYHLNKVHDNIGGADGVKKLLDIPLNAKLISSKERARLHDKATKTKPQQYCGRRRGIFTPHTRKKANRTCSRNRSTTMARNLRDSCEAQLSHRVVDLAHKLGRTPNMREAKSEFGCGFVRTCERVYGGWTNTVRHVNLRVANQFKLAIDDVVGMFSEYYKVHGRFPTSGYSARMVEPPLPSPTTVCKVLGVKTFSEARKKLARHLRVTFKPQTP